MWRSSLWGLFRARMREMWQLDTPRNSIMSFRPIILYQHFQNCLQPMYTYQHFFQARQPVVEEFKKITVVNWKETIDKFSDPWLSNFARSILSIPYGSKHSKLPKNNLIMELEIRTGGNKDRISNNWSPAWVLIWMCARIQSFIELKQSSKFLLCHLERLFSQWAQREIWSTSTREAPFYLSESLSLSTREASHFKFSESLKKYRKECKFGQLCRMIFLCLLGINFHFIQWNYSMDFGEGAEAVRSLVVSWSLSLQTSDTLW